MNQNEVIDLTGSSDRSSLRSVQSIAASKSNGAASKRTSHDFESLVNDSLKNMTSTSTKRNASKSRRVIELPESSDSESDNDGRNVSHTSKRPRVSYSSLKSVTSKKRPETGSTSLAAASDSVAKRSRDQVSKDETIELDSDSDDGWIGNSKTAASSFSSSNSNVSTKRPRVSTDSIPSSKKRPENDRSIGSTSLAAASAKRSRDQVSKDETIELDSHSDDGWIGNSKTAASSFSSSNSNVSTKRPRVSIGSTSLVAAAAADSSLKVITSKSKRRAKDQSSSSLLVDSDSPLTKRPHVSVTTSTSLTGKPASRAKSASTKAKAEAKARRKSSEEEKYGIGPFAHLYDKDSIELIHKFILEMAELHNSQKGKGANHFDGLYPYIPFEELHDEATITDLTSRAHPSFFQMIMSPNFNAPFITEETLSALQTATLGEGRISEEYQLDLTVLPKTHCGKELKHQTDASKFAESCSGAYIKAHVGKLGDFKSTARSYLSSNESKHDKKLPAFLQKALARHETLGTGDNESISVQYVGTTSRQLNVRWVEHDTGCSLNQEFFEVFAKNFQMPIMWSQPGDIGGAEMVEAIVAGLLQMATLRTLLLTNPKATYSHQGKDGTSLTLVNAGINVVFGQGSQQVVAYLKSMVAQGQGNTRLSSLKNLPPCIASFVDNNMDAIITYSSSNLVHSNGKTNTTFEARFNRKLETPAEVLDDSTADTLLSFCSHSGAEKAWENKLKKAAKQGIDLEEFKSDFGKKMYSALLDKKMAATTNPTLSIEQAKSQHGKQLYSANVDKKMAANPTLSREQAKSQIAAPGGQATKDYNDRKFNRKSDVVFACLRCAKVGVVSLKLFAVDGKHTGGLQDGRSKFANKGGAQCPNEACKKHKLWLAVEEETDVMKLKADTMPDWIQSLCDNNMCSLCGRLLQQEI